MLRLDMQRLTAAFFTFILVFNAQEKHVTAAQPEFLDTSPRINQYKQAQLAHDFRGRNLLRNGIGLTPPMGWSSWSHFGCGINETIVRATADAMVSSGLGALGYEYINIDDCWAEPKRDDHGNIVPKVSTFPSGIKALADYVHSKGLKFGIYSDAGYYTCKQQPGSLGHELQDASLFASWGVDYLKYGNCYNDGTKPEVRYSVMRDALRSTGRPIFFSVDAWDREDSAATWAPKVGNSWRTTVDSKGDWNSVIERADQNDKWANYAGPGGWNDPDILSVGNGLLTKDEYMSQFSVWALMKAPLLIGGDVTRMDSDTLEILSNKDVIEINQDSVGIQAKKVKRDGDLEVWAGPLSYKSRTVLLLWNRSGQPANITAHFEDLGFHATAVVQARDLWEHAELTASQFGSIEAKVDAHSVKMFRLLTFTPK